MGAPNWGPRSRVEVALFWMWDTCEHGFDAVIEAADAVSVSRGAPRGAGRACVVGIVALLALLLLALPLFCVGLLVRVVRGLW